MPLVLADEERLPVTDIQERARKIKPEYSRGPLVRVAGGRNQAEAELIQNLLLEEGVPSMTKRSTAFDVPDMLAAGERDVFVPESGAEAARDMLLDADLMPSAYAVPAERPNGFRLGAVFLGCAATASLICWGLIELTA